MICEARRAVTVLILHGTWAKEQTEESAGQFFVWAERIPGGRRGRRAHVRSKEGALHPFHARPEEVREAVLLLAPALAQGNGTAVWRFSAQRDAPSFLGKWFRLARRRRSRRQRSTKGLRLSQLLEERWSSRPGKFAASPPRFCWATSLLSRLPIGRRGRHQRSSAWNRSALLERGREASPRAAHRERLLPSLERDATGYSASWRPVFDDSADADRLARLDHGPRRRLGRWSRPRVKRSRRGFCSRASSKRRSMRWRATGSPQINAAGRRCEGTRWRWPGSKRRSAWRQNRSRQRPRARLASEPSSRLARADGDAGLEQLVPNLFESRSARRQAERLLF